MSQIVSGRRTRHMSASADDRDDANAGGGNRTHTTRKGHRILSQLTCKSVERLELPIPNRSATVVRDLERGVFDPFERRRRVFAPSSAAFTKSGRVLAALAASEGWQAFDEQPSLLDDALIAASCRERGITLVTRGGDFKRLAPFIKGFRYAVPWPTPATNAGEWP
jgi:predicted nucleic acid-binding protein